MAEHTPGPWTVGLNGHGEGAVFPSTDRMEFPVALRPRFTRDAAWEANARLIASAPELLEELTRALEWLEIDPVAEERGVVADIRASIAKATGAA